MRALVFHGPGVLSVQERPDPVANPGEALLRVVAAGICGSDLHGYTGKNGRRWPDQVMGHEVACRVISAGSGGSGTGGYLRPGQLVTVNPVLGCLDCGECRQGRPQRCVRRRIIGVDPAISAGFAEQLAAPVRNVVPLDGALPADVGCLVEPLAVGWHAVARVGASPADRVLVIGGGPIGQSAALAARRLGVTQIVVCEPDPHRRSLLSELGFLAVSSDRGDLARATAAMPGGPPTVVLDAVGSSDSLSAALAHSAAGARVCLVGMNAPVVEIPAYAVSTAERSITGSFCYDDSEFAATAGWVASCAQELSRLVERRVTLDEAPDTFRQLAAGELAASKVLVYPNGLE